MSTCPSPPKPWEQSNDSTTTVPTSTMAGTTSTTNPTLSSVPTTSANAPQAATGMLSTPYGSRYGVGGYGGMTGGYGTSYGGAYGGGYGAYGSGYGGYGGGYGGYGGGYGGYGMSRLGGMYGGGMNGPMQDPSAQFGWLHSFNQMVASIGQITELLGMNADALNFCFGT